MGSDSGEKVNQNRKITDGERRGKRGRKGPNEKGLPGKN